MSSRAGEMEKRVWCMQGTAITTWLSFWCAGRMLLTMRTKNIYWSTVVPPCGGSSLRHAHTSRLPSLSTFCSAVLEGTHVEGTRPSWQMSHSVLLELHNTPSSPGVNSLKVAGLWPSVTVFHHCDAHDLHQHDA